MSAALKMKYTYEPPVVDEMAIDRKSMTIVGGCYSIDRNCNGSSNGCGAVLHKNENDIIIEGKIAPTK